ncbi:MAG: hypothetical protein J0H94_02625 [Rhizobiales bacterium]|nr:hypothetical protein [Hyphomicrobiales bacterium]
MKPAFLAAALALAGLALLPAAPASADSFLDQARQAVQQAGKQIGNAAQQAGRSVRDFLTDNPDLNRDVVDFGEQVGMPGFDGAKPALGPVVLVSVPQGPSGATITLQVRGFPGDAPVDVLAEPAGGTATAIAHGTTSNRGDAFIDVTIPKAPDDGQNLTFVVATGDGRVSVRSELFNVVAAGAAVSVTGTLTKEGVECPAMRGDDGRLYTLIPPALGKLGPGDRVHVEGSVAEMTMCQQGTTVVVTKIEPAR